MPIEIMPRLDRVQSIEDLRRMARRRLPRSVFEFIDGGAEDELTLRENRAAFEQTRIRPRVLVDVDSPAMGIDLLGHASQMPLIVAPMGSCSLAWPDADRLLARAAKQAGIVYTLSTMATTRIETMAETVGGRLWFQLYVLRDQAFNFSLLDRARDAGYEALVVTVDLPTAGKREQDLRNGIQIPMKLHGRHIWEAITHPHWAMQFVRGGSPNFDNVRELMDGDDSGLTIAASVGKNLDAAFNWEKLTVMRDYWRGPMLVKGVQHPDDAKRLVAMGIDGIWVSNHGGRQLDGAMSSLAAVPAIREALGPDALIIVDSGVRRGVDVLKARMLGASACAIGRAALYGPAAAGADGAHKVMSIFADELQRAMRLAGVAQIDQDETVQSITGSSSR